MSLLWFLFKKKKTHSICLKYLIQAIFHQVASNWTDRATANLIQLKFLKKTPQCIDTILDIMRLKF